MKPRTHNNQSTQNNDREIQSLYNINSKMISLYIVLSPSSFALTYLWPANISDEVFLVREDLSRKLPYENEKCRGEGTKLAILSFWYVEKMLSWLSGVSILFTCT
jgi:hypothetical protein